MALVTTDGYRQLQRGPSLTFPYEPAERTRLSEAVVTLSRARGGEWPLLAEIEHELTRLSAVAVKAFLERFALTRDRVMYLGFAGFRISRAMRPVGDATLLANLTHIDVVHDFLAPEQEAGLAEAMWSLLGEPSPREVGTDPSMDHSEAEASAYLAVRAVRRLPVTASAGSGRAMTAGRVARAPRR